MKVCNLLESKLDLWTSHPWVFMSPYWACVIDLPYNITDEQFNQLLHVSFPEADHKQYFKRYDYWKTSTPRKEVRWADVVEYFSTPLSSNTSDFDL